MSIDFEKDVQTPATVKPGMGYPNDRVELSPTAIGWQGLDVEDLTHVSRETIGEDR
jgi:hypothetical protein